MEYAAINRSRNIRQELKQLHYEDIKDPPMPVWDFNLLFQRAAAKKKQAGTVKCCIYQQVLNRPKVTSYRLPQYNAPTL